MLTLEGLQFARDGFLLDAEISITDPGVTAIIGPSGGGKSTLLSLIAGFEVPDAGRILWKGTDLANLAPGKRPVAMLFQDNNLFPHLDVTANVALGESLLAKPAPEVLDRANDALNLVGLGGLGKRKPRALSGGQQCRAGLARILLTDKPVVMIDEAFSSLGPALRVEMLDLVKRLLPDAMILMVTHDPDDAVRVAGHVIFVDSGRIHAPVATPAFFDNQSEDVRRYLA